MSQDSIRKLVQSQPEDDPDDVLFNTHYGVRTIELNRPHKLNSLNGSMARKIVARLLEWQKSDMANVVVIAGAGPKAFCAGGDVAALAQLNSQGTEGQAKSLAYLGLEYQLDHLIATYGKPYVAYMDGITMGGGAGLAVHAPIRVATERTMFAMPETSIGFFPDVGASFFLSRLEGHVGTYLALTSDRLRGANVFYAGLATHYTSSAALPALTARLAELVFNDYDDMATRLSIIEDTVAEYSNGLPPNEPIVLIGELRRAIDRCFGHNSVEEISEALQLETENKDNEPATQAWASSTLKTLQERSPTSLRVALRQMRLGKSWSIDETFQREYALASAFMSHPDFTEGVSARLLRKPAETPSWRPASLHEVSNASIEDMFQPQEGQARLDLIVGDSRTSGYREYPHTSGLPRESDIQALVRQGGQTQASVLQRFLRAKKQQLGVQEKVTEVLSRCCESDSDGCLHWI